MLSVRETNIFAEQLLLNIGQVSLTTALVILPLLALRKVLRRRYPTRMLCLLWAVLVVRLLIPVQFSLPETPVQVTPQLTHVTYSNEVPRPEMVTIHTISPVDQWMESANVEDHRQATPHTSYRAVYYGVILFLLWAAVAWAQLFRLLRDYPAFLKRLHHTAWAVDSPAILEAYCIEAKRLGLRREIPLFYSPEADGPMLAGILRPMLVLPAAGIPAEDASMVLRHELTHYKRHDLLLKLAASVARCLHWFNPAVHLLVQALFEDIELACDSRVVEGMDTESRRRYGEIILNCAASQCAVRQAVTTCFTSDKESLKTRLGELFATGVKRRGIALLLVCTLTVGIVGGAVSIGSRANAAAPDSASNPDNISILSRKKLDIEIAATLAGGWASGWTGRNMEPAMQYLTREMQEKLFNSMGSDPEDPDKTFIFDPDDPYYGIPEENRHGFWWVGVSSPWMRAYSIEPDLENNGAYVVYNWTISGVPDSRTMEYVHFTQENGEWRISSVDGGGTYGETVNSAENFRLLYGNDLGLPNFQDYAEFVARWRTEDPSLVPVFLDDPVEAAEGLLYLEGGSGEITGQVTIRGKFLGNIVTYTFADGSAVDIVMNGYLPVDWRIEGKNNRTMVDLAAQWASGEIAKDTQCMFPLLTENATDELIAVQQNYSSTTGDEWYWKHGKYGSSPTAWEYGVQLDVGKNAARVTYTLGSSADTGYRICEILHFIETPAGLKIDRVRDLLPSEQLPENVDAAQYELIERSQKDYFTMLWLDEPILGDLSQFPNAVGSYRSPFGLDLPHRDWMDDPVETVKQLYYLEAENRFAAMTWAYATLLSSNETTALVRITFLDDSGQMLVELERDAEKSVWKVTDLYSTDAVTEIRSANELAEAYGGINNFPWRTAFLADTPITDPEDVLWDTLALSRDTQLTHIGYTEYDKPFGRTYTAKFPDGSQAQFLLTQRWDERWYPVNWLVNGKNTRSITDLATQWATGVCEKDTRLMFPLLTSNGKNALVEVQKNYSGEDWGWNHGKYGSSPTAGSFLLRQVDELTIDVIYNEYGGGYFNHHSIERLYFVNGRQGLLLNRWEEIERTDETDFEWYRKLYTFTENTGTNYCEVLNLDTTYPIPEEDIEAARLLAGVSNGDLNVEISRTSPGSLITTSDGENLYRLFATMRFEDNSGWIVAEIEKTFDGKLAPGAAYMENTENWTKWDGWRLLSLYCTDSPPN